MKIKYSFAVFLYAYLNQIDLSLDRSRWEPLDNLGGIEAKFLLKKLQIISLIKGRYIIMNNGVRKIYTVIYQIKTLFIHEEKQNKVNQSDKCGNKCPAKKEIKDT